MKYIYNILIALDQFVNVIFSGDPDETISSAVGRKSIRGIWWAKKLEMVIDWIFFVLIGEVGHCRNSIERINKY